MASGLSPQRGARGWCWAIAPPRHLSHGVMPVYSVSSLFCLLLMGVAGERARQPGVGDAIRMWGGGAESLLSQSMA